MLQVLAMAHAIVEISVTNSQEFIRSPCDIVCENENLVTIHKMVNKLNKREYVNEKYYVEKVGRGKPLYVVGGGPGMDYSYLYPWLLPLSKYYELNFYHQYGIFENVSADLNTLVQQLYEILIADPREKEVLVHSFGSHLLWLVLEKYPDIKIDHIICINPMALNAKEDKRAEETLRKRIPKEVEQKIENLLKMEQKEADLMALSLLFPYYVFDEEISINLTSYCRKMSDKIQEELNQFDVSSVVSKLNTPILLLKGEYDFVSITGTLKLQIIARKTVIYEKCGHFAFAEKNQEVRKEIQNFLKKENK